MIKLVTIAIHLLLTAVAGSAAALTPLEEFQNCHCHDPHEWSFTDLQPECQQATSIEQVREVVRRAERQCSGPEFDRLGAAGAATSMTCMRHYALLEKAIRAFERGDPSVLTCRSEGAPLS